MSVVLLILPDFLLIALGWILLHRLGWTPIFFRDLEKLVYYILFPALLFQSIVRTPISLGVAGNLFQATVMQVAFGVLMAWLAVPVLRPDRVAHASMAQTAYRFNTYMALSIGSSFGGSVQTIIAIFVGFAVPLVNLAAVHSLARQHGRLLRELARNPLILATCAGLAANFARLDVPGFVSVALDRLGACALAAGLLCVGATLSLRAMRGQGRLMAWLISVRLLLMPTVALIIGMVLGLSSVERMALLLFAAVPTASSAHVLAARMGGQPEVVAVTMSVGTIFSAITLPLWLLVGSHL